MAERSIVGDPINFRGLVYGPMNENGVIFLFGKIVEDLFMHVEEIKPGCPDCIARRFTGKGWEKIRIEFEYLSSNFVIHKHNPRDCDVIVCWEHDWKDCPLEVIPLKEVIKELDNYPVERPNVSIKKEGKGFEKYYKDYPEKVQTIFTKFDKEVSEISQEIWAKKLQNKASVNYYSPERVFIYTDFQKQGLKITLYTGGEQISGVKPFGYSDAAEKWGYFHLTDESQIDSIVPIINRSYNLIKNAIQHNETTGWYAKISQGEEKSE